jgi:hypothetical protein
VVLEVGVKERNRLLIGGEEVEVESGKQDSKGSGMRRRSKRGS